MILLTGAAGKTGRSVIGALSAQGKAVRALVYRSEQIQIVKAFGAQETLVGDLRDRTAVESAAQGIRAVYHICPNISPDEILIGQNMIAAAQSAGIAHFVYHSVLHPQTEAMPHHWQKLRVEERLLESGLPYTILQPTAYMENTLAHWEQIVEQGIYPVPYAVETLSSMVALEDVAQAAALVLTEPGHAGATYELVGTKATSQNEIAIILSQQLGRAVRAEAISIQSWERSARTSGLGDYQVETLIKMFHYNERCGFWGNSHVLNWLLGRPPTSFAAFIKRIVREQQQ